MIALYAVIDHPGPPLPSVGDAALGAAGTGHLAAVWAPADGDVGPEMTIDGLRHHEAIVEALMADRDLLPMRYGTRVADVGAAAQLLIERREELADALGRVRGSVELAVRVAAAPGAATDVARALVVVHGPLSGRARATRCRPRAGGDLLRGAYLVERDAVAAFAGRVGALQAAHPELRILCTGPWPPYSFTG